MIERLYKSDIMMLIPVKDWRSIKIWCFNNCVTLLKDKGSNKKYAIKEEFEEAMDKVPKEYLMRKFSEEKASVVNSGINFCSQYLSALDNNRLRKSYDYNIKGEHEKWFQSILQRKLNELPSQSDGRPVTHSKK